MNLAELSRDKVSIIAKGAWSCEDVLHFTNSGKDTACINDSGETCVPVISIDHVLSDHPVNFIKMDIEGAELEALRGARHVIEKNKPTLAISVYHKPEDIIMLLDEILSMNETYKFYLRHYSFAFYDTVLYAV